VLRIYFDLKTRVNIESWNVVIIEILFYASQKDVCIFLFRKRNTKIEKYDSRDLNSLSINIVEITEIFEHVSRHLAHQIAIEYDLQNKIFRRQIIDLHKLYIDHQCRWWKNQLLDKSMTVSYHIDIYAECHFTTMFLLNVNSLNETQRRDVNYVRRLLNEIELVTKSTTTRKTTFVLIVVQSFLWISFSIQTHQNAVKIAEISTEIKSVT
jgi:hypothetical protein